MTEADLPLVEFFVEADSFARQELWSAHAHDGLTESKIGPRPRVRWVQDYSGFAVVIGHIGDLPVNVMFAGATLNGHRVAFYETVSRANDSEMVLAWIKARANPTWDNGRRPAFTDAMNFHHCLDHVRGGRS